MTCRCSSRLSISSSGTTCSTASTRCAIIIMRTGPRLNQGSRRPDTYIPRSTKGLSECSFPLMVSRALWCFGAAFMGLYTVPQPPEMAKPKAMQMSFWTSTNGEANGYCLPGINLSSSVTVPQCRQVYFLLLPPVTVYG